MSYYLINGEFNKGLNVYNKGRLILYSICSLIGLDEIKINILNKNQKLLLSLTDKENICKKLLNLIDDESVEIEFHKRKGISYKGFLKILDVNTHIVFKYNYIVFLNPYIKIYLGDKKIGFVKKKYFSFKKEFFVELDNSLNYSYHIYILIYLLMFETVFDHD